jgi:ribosomal protein L40E
LALTTNEKYILVAILAAIMIFVIFFEMRYMRGKAKVVRHAAQKKDEAYNAVLTTRSVINVMQRQGAETRTAQTMVGAARDAMERGDYDRCMDLCEKARDELTSPSRKTTEPAEGHEDDAIEKERFEKIAESILAAKNLTSTKTDSYKGTKLSVESDGNFMSARFEINTAKSDIRKAVESGLDTSEAQDLVTEAEAAFVVGGYTKALSLAIKARKAVSAEAEGETIPLRAGEEPEEPEAEPTAEELSISSRWECGHCGAPLEADDKFCHKCGTRVERERVCDSCGTKARSEDTFCRKCGSKIA